MVYLPAMLIFTLAASLVVAFIMNPVFAVDFMNHPEEEKDLQKRDIQKAGILDRCLILGILLDRDACDLPAATC